MPAVHRTDPQYLANITQGRSILLKMTRGPLLSHTGSLISYCRDIVRCPGVIGQSAHRLQRCKLIISEGIALHSCLVHHIRPFFRLLRPYLSSGVRSACCGPQNNLKGKIKLANPQNQQKKFTNYYVKVAARRSTRCFYNSGSVISRSLSLNKKREQSTTAPRG